MDELFIALVASEHQNTFTYIHFNGVEVEENEMSCIELKRKNRTITLKQTKQPECS